MGRAGRSSRSVLTVLFTDIVGSTELAAELGDSKWQKLLDRHNGLIRSELARYSAREIGTAGDGFLAVFHIPAEAIACAYSLVNSAPALGTQLRAGIHTGECEVRGDDLQGIAVHIASRVSDLARGGEVLVSGTVRDLVSGSGTSFVDRGSQKLKGVPGKWQIFSVSAVPARKKRTARGAKSRVTGLPSSVMVVDDHPLWRDTLRKVIEQGRAGKVVAEASDGDEAVKVAARAKPDVVVMDMHLGTMDGASATRALVAKNPEIKVLMLSSSDERDLVLESVRAGASGYLIKTAESDEITDAIRRVHAGELVFPPALANVVLAELRGEGSPVRKREGARVALAAEGVIDRRGLVKVLGDAGFTVSTEAEDAEELAGLIEDDLPNVVIVDIGGRRRRVEAGLAAVRDMRTSRPELPILVLADEVDADHALALISGEGRGAGYVLKDRVRDLEELADAVERVAKGESVIDPDVVTELVAARRKQKPLEQLTERERDVLALMAEGRSNQAICDNLHLSPKSVEGHVGNIFSKLSLEPAPDDHRRVLAVLLYLQSGRG